MIHRVQFEQWVPATIEKVFLFLLIRAIYLGSCLANRTELARRSRVPFVLSRFRTMDCVNYKFEWNHPFVDIQNEGTIQAISASPRILGGGAKRHERNDRPRCD
jgi:hypothetical protein